MSRATFGFEVAVAIVVVLSAACSDEIGDRSPDELADAGVDSSTANADAGQTACVEHDDCAPAEHCEHQPMCGSGVCVDDAVPDVEPGTMYTEWESWPCVVDSCNCSEGADRLWDGLMACEPIHNGFHWNFGSVELRVMGRNESGQCVVEVSEILEGSVTQRTCRFDFPIEPWDGLRGDYSLMSPFFDGFPGECDEPESCCRLDGCPNPCSDEQVESLVCFRFPLEVTPCEFDGDMELE